MATVRGGGLGFLTVLLAFGLMAGARWTGELGWVVPAVVAAVAFISFMDDMKGMPALVRLGFHAMGALALGWGAGFWGLKGWDASLGALMPVPGWMAFGLMVMWMVGYTNAFNFMDGINGIAGIQAGLGGLAMWSIARMGGAAVDSSPMLFCMALAGAALGFLPHNFPRARMFMGDVGSAPLGMLLSFLVLWLCREHGRHLLIPLALVHVNFILDTLVTLVRRMLRGENLLEPHREHFYQRLVRAGRKHAFVSCWEAVLLGVGSVVLMGVVRLGLREQLLGAAAVIAMWSGFFVYAEWVFRRHRLATQAAPAG